MHQTLKSAENVLSVLADILDSAERHYGHSDDWREIEALISRILKAMPPEVLIEEIHNMRVELLEKEHADQLEQLKRLQAQERALLARERKQK